jgi:hypothetical protein
MAAHLPKDCSRFGNLVQDSKKNRKTARKNAAARKSAAFILPASGPV